MRGTEATEFRVIVCLCGERYNVQEGDTFRCMKCNRIIKWHKEYYRR